MGISRVTLAAAALSIGLGACSGTISPVPGPASGPPMVPPARGTIISMTRVGTITEAQMSAGLPGQVITALGGAPECNVTLYAITYQTIGVQGEPADASEGFFVPGNGCKKPYPLVGYAQGTNVIKAQKITNPTKRNIEPVVVAAIYAAHGDAVAATDYLGLGYSSYPYQPYLVVSAEASAVIDSMRAARKAAKMLHVSLSRNVLLTGHSQGGQAAMATQREIEASDAGEFHLVADAPSSGPYALTQTLVDGVTHPGQNAPVLAAYALTSYQHVYSNVIHARGRVQAALRSRHRHAAPGEHVRAGGQARRHDVAVKAQCASATRLRARLRKRSDDRRPRRHSNQRFARRLDAGRTAGAVRR